MLLRILATHFVQKSLTHGAFDPVKFFQLLVSPPPVLSYVFITIISAFVLYQH